MRWPVKIRGGKRTQNGKNGLIMKILEELEKQISAARLAYNASVTDYNNSVQMVPTNIIAGSFNFKEKPLFQIEATERENPQVGNLLCFFCHRGCGENKR